MIKRALNPFVFPERGDKCNQPLKPWEIEAHESLYVDVDGTKLAFEQFIKYVNGVDIKSSGFISLVTGSDGCGKSALLNRCAHYFKVQHASKLEAVIIDLSDEGQPSLPVAEKVAAACQLILDHVELIDGLLSTAQEQRLQSRIDRPLQALDYLSSTLLSKKKCLVIILPAIELVEELKSYTTLRRKGVFLLCETSEPVVREYATAHYGPAVQFPINLMSLGVLNPEDGWKLVSARAANADENSPVISELAIRQFMDTRIGSSGKTTIRELQVACKEVTSHAIEHGKSEIVFDDFAHYYLRAAVL